MARALGFAGTETSETSRSCILKIIRANFWSLASHCFLASRIRPRIENLLSTPSLIFCQISGTVFETRTLR